MGAELGITPVIIRGEELKQKGFGGTVTVQCSHTENSPLFRTSSVFLFVCVTAILNCCSHLHLAGIYGVGKAAEHPPALAVLSHKPEGATQTIAWVGKGIVYDTGGLSIKGKVPHVHLD